MNLPSFSFLLAITGCLLVVDAHPHGWWWWWRYNRCNTEINVSVQSSECSRPLSGVSIRSPGGYASVVSSSEGVYTVRVCSLPARLEFWKFGYRPMRMWARHSEETVQMYCRGRACKATTVIATVSSACGEPLAEVNFTSPDIMFVMSPQPGIYFLHVCSLPAQVTSGREGFQTLTSTVTDTTAAVQLSCTGPGCGGSEITLTVESSDCSTPVDNVNITSSSAITVTSTGPGTYSIHTCSMPLTVTLSKLGFDPLTTSLSGTSETLTLSCSGPHCTASVATVSVTSDCTATVAGVTIGGQEVVDVSSSAPGSYQIAVCLQPSPVTFERIGYISSQTNISDGSIVTLSCIVPTVIIRDPQPKYRAPGESVKLCCEAQPSTGVTYKWFKDGTELGETSNELTLTSLTAADDGLYKCSAKLTADPSLPAAVSEEARLTIRANSDSCADARSPKLVELLPGCIRDIGQCENRACRSNPSSPEQCSDDNICCELTSVQQIDCGGGNIIPVTMVTGCSCSCSTPFIIVSGSVEDSATDTPLEGITVSLVGDPTATSTTDVNGDFLLTIQSTRRRLVIKAEDSNGTYLDAYVVETLPSETYTPVSVLIAMVKKAPLIQINPSVENSLSISGDPSQQNSGPASLKVPANAFFSSDGTQYSGSVFASLTYLDPLDPEVLETMPGQFVTLTSEGEAVTLVTQGVFSISFEDNAGNPLTLNADVEVYGTPGYSLWRFDEQTATWTLVNTLPGRRRRQTTQQDFIGSFNPQGVAWWNIDRIYSEPDCYFKVRIFEEGFSPANEIQTDLTIVPTIRQFLASGTEAIKYYSPASTPGCFHMKCPPTIAQAKISFTALETIYGLSASEVSLLPAMGNEYSTEIQTVLQASPYFYSIWVNDTTKIFINTPSAATGPFYQTMAACNASLINETAFWFAKQSNFMEEDFYGDYQGRCVGKIHIFIGSEIPVDSNNITLANLSALSIWSETNYGLRTASIYNVSENEYASCFEYRCSLQNETVSDMTSVVIGLTNDSAVQLNCYLEGGSQLRRKRLAASFPQRLYPPVLDPASMPSGYFFNDSGDVQDALDQCTADEANYAGYMYCYPDYDYGDWSGWRTVS